MTILPQTVRPIPTPIEIQTAGKTAFGLGFKETQCPYKKHTDHRYQAWMTGFHSAKRAKRS